MADDQPLANRRSELSPEQQGVADARVMERRQEMAAQFEEVDYEMVQTSWVRFPLVNELCFEAGWW